MPRDEFDQLTTDELMALLRNAQKDLASGAAFIGGADGDVSFSKVVQVRLNERVRRIQRTLSLRDPARWPPEDYIGASETRPDFS